MSAAGRHSPPCLQQAPSLKSAGLASGEDWQGSSLESGEKALALRGKDPNDGPAKAVLIGIAQTQERAYNPLQLSH